MMVWRDTPKLSGFLLSSSRSIDQCSGRVALTLQALLDKNMSSLSGTEPLIVDLLRKYNNRIVRRESHPDTLNAQRNLTDQRRPFSKSIIFYFYSVFILFIAIVIGIVLCFT